MTLRRCLLTCALATILASPAYAQNYTPSNPTYGAPPSAPMDNPSLPTPSNGNYGGYGQDIHQDRTAIQQDNQAIQSDRSQISQDDQTINQDRQQLHQDYNSGNMAGAQQERQAIQQERQQRFGTEQNMHQDEANRFHERRDMRRDEWARRDGRDHWRDARRDEWHNNQSGWQQHNGHHGQGGYGQSYGNQRHVARNDQGYQPGNDAVGGFRRDR